MDNQRDPKIFNLIEPETWTLTIITTETNLATNPSFCKTLGAWNFGRFMVDLSNIEKVMYLMISNEIPKMKIFFKNFQNFIGHDSS